MGQPRRITWLTYRAVNLVNGESYVGMTGRSLAGRRSGHKGAMLDKKKSRPMFFTLALRKYGFDMFRFTLLKRYETKAEMVADEIRLIALWKPEYNIGPGGEGGVAPPAEQFAKFMAGRERASVNRRRPVICLSDGRVFDSGKEAAAHYGVSRSGICLVLNGTRASLKGKFFAYYTGTEQPLIDPGGEIEKLRIVQRNLMVQNTTRKAVICVNDGREYTSLSDAAEAYGIDIGAVSDVVRRVRLHHKGRVFVYAGENIPSLPMLTLDKGGKWRKDIEPQFIEASTARLRAVAERNRKPVICLNDGKRFASCKEASAFYDLSASSAAAVARGVLVQAKGYRFAYANAEA